MKLKRRLLTLLLAGIMAAGTLTACSNNENADDTTTTAATEAPKGDDTTAKADDSAPTAEAVPLVVAYTEFNGKFSRFFAETDYDQDVAGLTNIGSLTTDRVGDIVYNAIEGETRSYNGTDYTYTGPVDILVTRDESADTTTYKYHLRDDMKFADGEPVTIDDFLFGLYVYLDPAYDGNSTLFSQNIQGAASYRTGIPADVLTKYKPIASAILAAGPGYTAAATDSFTQEQYDTYWNEAVITAWKDELNNIVGWLKSNGYGGEVEEFGGVAGDEAYDALLGLSTWGFAKANDDGVLEGAGTGATWDTAAGVYPTFDDFYNETVALYGGDFVAFYSAEDPDGIDQSDAANALFIAAYAGESADTSSTEYISGIKKIDDYTAEIVLDGFSANAIYQISVDLTPMHYYGDKSQWDFDAHKFGHPKGDLSLVHAKDGEPLGAGPYTFVKYENKVVYFEANPLYYRGEPKIKNVQFKETQESEKVTAVATGAVDISEPSNSKLKLAEISKENSNGETTGDKIYYTAVDNLGYGYIGLNAALIKVGDDPGSKASRDLRKALATVLAVYRDISIDSYYGDSAEVINYPISSTSWAAPQKTDPGYELAYSKDVNGNDIYTSGQTPDERYAAALNAAVGYLEAAGYTFTDGKATAAPAGASLTYTLSIGDEAGEHPAALAATMASEALKTIGIDMQIELISWSLLSDKLSKATFEITAAAWASTIDPDIYQLYSGADAVGAGGIDSNHYMIRDDKLDQLMLETRKSPDNAYRKTLFKECFDIILDWAVEVPSYQRQNCIIFSTERVNTNTIPKDMTPYWGWAAEIETLALN